MQSDTVPSHHTIFQQAARDLWQGSALGIGVSFLNPFFYAKNMKMIGAPFNVKHCFRGTVINATTSVPQAAVQIATIGIMKKLLMYHDRKDSSSLWQGIAATCVAGVASGLITVPVELVVQNVQKSKQSGFTSRKTLQKVFRINGFCGIFAGTGALTGREIIYVASYHILAEKISSIYSSIFGNSLVTEIFGAGTAGAISGAVTTPLDNLRALKHDQAVSRIPENYRKMTLKIGYSGLFRGLAERSFAIGLACIIMSVGGKLFNKQ